MSGSLGSKVIKVIFILIVVCKVHHCLPLIAQLRKNVPSNKSKVFMNSKLDPVNFEISEIWKSRRNIAKAVLKASDFLDSAPAEKTETETKKTSKAQDTVLLGAFVAVIATLGVRMGGRFTLLQLVGLDLDHDVNLRNQLSFFLSSFMNSSDEQKSAILFAAWFVAKAFCIDFLTVILAISSGIIYDNLFVATATSVACSSISSAIVFISTRLFGGEKVQSDISKRPLIRALDRSIGKNGLKTVFSLRISPLLPIPIGGYNYIYALSSVSFFDFLLGVSLGSIKPYLLDAFLGNAVRDIFFSLTNTGTNIIAQGGNSITTALQTATSSMSESSSLLASSALSTTPSSPWWLPIIVVGSVLLVSSFAADLFSSTYKEIEEELRSITETSADENIDTLRALGMQETDLPPPLRTAKQAVDSAWLRIESVLADEWRRHKPKEVVKETAVIDEPLVAAKSSSSSLLPNYQEFEFEEIDFKNWKRDLIESSIFLFVLLNYWSKEKQRKDRSSLTSNIQ